MKKLILIISMMLMFGVCLARGNKGTLLDMHKETEFNAYKKETNNTIENQKKEFDLSLKALSDNFLEFKTNLEANVNAKIVAVDKSLNQKIGDVAGDMNTTTNDVTIFYVIMGVMAAIIIVLIVDDAKDKKRMFDLIKTNDKYETELDNLRKEGKIV